MMRPYYAHAACILALAAGAGARAEERQVSEFRYDHAPVGASILICPISVAPAACDAHTATDVLLGPPSPGLIGCGLQSEALLAGSGIPIGKSQYVKVVCERKATQAD